MRIIDRIRRPRMDNQDNRPTTSTRHAELTRARVGADARTMVR